MSLGTGSGPSPTIESLAIPVPTRFTRVGKSGFTWGISRTFPGYFADTTKQVLGNATKWVLRTNVSGEPEYLVKYAQKFGRQETHTEFFINQLGNALGFSMAHSGIVLLDGTLAFLTKIFTSSEESLRHGSLIIEDFFKDEKALERVRRREEQEFYSIDFVVKLLEAFCGPDFSVVFPKFVEMLIFDAVIGSMDRHSQNWGVVGQITEPVKYRFAPIFDSARALLWSMDEAQLRQLSSNDSALQAHINRAKPCLGPVRNHPKVNHCNHFEFIDNLLELYPHQTIEALQKVPDDAAQRSAKLLHQFPFDVAFSSLRKQLIVKILSMRTSKLKKILKKGGAE